MKTHTALAFLKTYIVYIGLGVVVVAAAITIGVSKSHQAADANLPVTATSTLGNTVQISGHVRAAEDVDLSIKASGRVTAINKKVGDSVVKGQVIVATDAASLYASLQQAQATLAKEQSNLDQLTASARPEDIAIADAAYQAAAENIFGKLQASYSAADDAIRNKVDQFIYSPTSPSGRVNFPVSDSSTELDLTQGRYALEAQLVAMQKAIPTTDTTVTDATYTQFKMTLDNVTSYLNKFANAINNIGLNAHYTSAELAQQAQWRADISSARSEVTSATQDLVNARQSVISAQNQLAIKKTGGSASDIKVQQAVVLGAQAQVNNILAQIADTEIIAPFNGIVTRQDTDIGQTLTGGVSIVSVISAGAYEIDAYIPEVSVSQVAVGNKAKVTLDALGTGVTFDAEVVSLDLSESVVDGVPSYKTRLQFLTTDDRIRSGMTANVSIAVTNSFGNTATSTATTTGSVSGNVSY